MASESRKNGHRKEPIASLGWRKNDDAGRGAHGPAWDGGVLADGGCGIAGAELGIADGVSLPRWWPPYRTRRATATQAACPFSSRSIKSYVFKRSSTRLAKPRTSRNSSAKVLMFVPHTGEACADIRVSF